MTVIQNTLPTRLFKNRSTIIIIDYTSTSYLKILEILRLTTLTERKERGNAIQCFKINNNIREVSF